MSTAQQQYPILQGLDLGYKYNPGGGSGFLEFWPADETGTPSSPRPSEFPMGKPGVEVYDPKTRPIDVLGDIVSHHLIHTDPTIKHYYQQFQDSMTSDQHATLRDQYDYAQKNQNEQRPYDVWAEHSGIPSYFRGYPFQQWDKAEQMYTPDQLKMFDQMMMYLKSPAHTQTSVGSGTRNRLRSLHQK